MKSEKKADAKYGMLSNSLFIVKEALEVNPIVLVFTLLQALLVVAGSLLELYVTPVILRSLERHDAGNGYLPWRLLGIISIFTLGSMVILE